MPRKKVDTETIVRVYNECCDITKTAEILGYNKRYLEIRIRKECRWRLEAR